jgi:predicted transcriptional regulator
MNDITNKFEEIFDLAQMLQDKVLELGELIASLKESSTN